MSYNAGLNALAYDPKLIGKLCDIIGSMPNIEFPTMGGAIFWDTLAEENGWKLQKNKFTDHCRVIDPEDIRKAWGSEKAMKAALSRLGKDYPSQESYDYTCEGVAGGTSRKIFCPNCGQKVPDGRFCKECGSRID